MWTRVSPYLGVREEVTLLVRVRVLPNPNNVLFKQHRAVQVAGPYITGSLLSYTPFVGCGGGSALTFSTKRVSHVELESGLL